MNWQTWFLKQNMEGYHQPSNISGRRRAAIAPRGRRGFDRSLRPTGGLLYSPSSAGVGPRTARPPSYGAADARGSTHPPGWAAHRHVSIACRKPRGSGLGGQILAMALVHAERALRIGRANLGSLAGSLPDGGDAPGPSELALCVV